MAKKETYIPLIHGDLPSEWVCTNVGVTESHLQQSQDEHYELQVDTDLYKGIVQSLYN